MIKRVVRPVDLLKLKLQHQTLMDRLQTFLFQNYCFSYTDDYRADQSSVWKHRKEKVTF